MKPTDLSAFRWMLALGILTSTTIAPAQEAVTSEPKINVTAPVLRKPGPPAKSRPADPTDPVFVLGPLVLRPHLVFRSVYGMGLPTRNRRHVASMIYTSSPGLGVDIGSHWTLDYTPTWVSYTARALDDTLDHSAQLQGAGVAGNWAWQFSERYGASSPILFETGGQTEQTTWATNLSATRSLGSGLTFQTTASLNERYGEAFPDTRDWATMNWLTVRFAPRLEAGLGVGAGYSDIVAQPDTSNERYMGRINWSPTDKLAFALDGGIEVRHSRSSAAKDMTNPIMNASLVYKPFEVTQITLESSRTVENSYYQNQVTENTSWRGSVEQRLLGRLYLTATYQRRNTDFESTTTTIPPVPSEDDPLSPVLISLPGRSDQVDSIDLRLSTQLLRRWTAAATYRRSHNRSDQPGFTFISTQFGVEVSCRY